MTGRQNLKNKAGTEYFVSPDGNDNNTGTSIDRPLATIQAAHDLVEAGDTIFLRGGTYKLPKDTSTRLTKSGTEDNPIRLVAYEDEQPVLDGSSWSRANTSTGENGKVLVIQKGDHWHVEGLELTGGPFLGYLADSVDGSVFKDLNSHSHNDTGFSLVGQSTNNLILGGDFHNNFDPQNHGQNADGIAIKFGSGEGNVIDGARLYNNSDDGLDLWSFESPITLRNTHAFGNGVDRWDHGPLFEGNGNGFKLSGGTVNRGPGADHILHNNVAWNNTSRGFDYNNNPGEMQVFNNTSYNNGYAGFNFNSGSHVLRNNLSFGDRVVELTGPRVDDADNSWNLDVNVTASDFLSLDGRLAEGPRKADGSLPDSGFLKLAPNSDLVDMGADVGAVFAGSAPDLGAIERGLPSNDAPVIRPEPTPETPAQPVTPVAEQPAKPDSPAPRSAEQPEAPDDPVTPVIERPVQPEAPVTRSAGQPDQPVGPATPTNDVEPPVTAAPPVTSTPPISEPIKLMQFGEAEIRQKSSSEWVRIDFDQPIEDAVVIAGPPTTNGGNPVTVRVRNVDEAGFEMQLDEWDYLDGAHMQETVSWMAIPAGEHTLADGRMISAGVTTGNHLEAEVTLNGFEDTPIVLAQIMSKNGKQAATDRISDVDAKGFSFRFGEEENNDGRHVPEDVGWVALSAGESETGSVGLLSAVDHNGAALDGAGGLVFADMQSRNGGNTATVRRNDDGLFIEEEQSADNETWHVEETVGYAIFAEESVALF